MRLDRKTRRFTGQGSGGGKPAKHGSRQLERLLQANQLDGRTKTAKMVREIADQLAEDAGGMPFLTNREKLLIERVAAQSVIVQSIEAWIFKQAGPVTPEGELLGVLKRGYVSHVAILARNLAALGLKPPRPNPAMTLEDYLKARDATNSDADCIVEGEVNCLTE